MESDISLEENHIDDIPQVIESENEILTFLFMMDEVKAVLFQMEHNKASGPYGFLTCWLSSKISMKSVYHFLS
jgi:hypothetical protein